MIGRVNRDGVWHIASSITRDGRWHHWRTMCGKTVDYDTDNPITTRRPRPALATNPTRVCRHCLARQQRLVDDQQRVIDQLRALDRTAR